MQIDAIAVELRPRPMTEAADLGARLVQAHAGSVWRSCLPVFAAVFLLALSTAEIAPWLPALVIFWLKPWLDRSVLFVLSRAVFGQPTRFADLWQAQRRVWWGQLAGSLLFQRLSPWRSFTNPVGQLEGQTAAARRRRRLQLLNGQRGAACTMHLVFAHAEMALLAGCLAVSVWLAPDAQRWELANWLAVDPGPAATLLAAAVYAAVVAVLEPFYVAAGFAMYLNRRVQLEAWDVEQEFRRAF